MDVKRTKKQNITGLNLKLNKKLPVESQSKINK